MTNIHNFIKLIDAFVDEAFPNTERIAVVGGEFIKDWIMELKEGDKRLWYSPYELFHKAEDYEETIGGLIAQWESVLHQ